MQRARKSILGTVCLIPARLPPIRNPLEKSVAQSKSLWYLVGTDGGDDDDLTEFYKAKARTSHHQIQPKHNQERHDDDHD